MKDLSNNMQFLYGVSERATDSLHPRKLQLQLDIRQERKNQSEQSGALKSEKESTLFAHLDETNRSKQEKLDKLNSDIDEIKKSIEEIKNAEKEAGYSYDGFCYTKNLSAAGSLRNILAILFLSIVLSIAGLSIFGFCECVDDMQDAKEKYYRMVERE